MDKIGMAIANSTVVNKAVDYLGDKQKYYKCKKELEDAKAKVEGLFLELGKTVYKKRPLTPGRTSTVIREEIAAGLVNVTRLEEEFSTMQPPAEEPPAPEDNTPPTEE